jgi:phytoene dehydrogenase-like protein
MSQALARRSSGPARHVYDVVIFGGELPGLLAACVLAKRGLQVLYAEHDQQGSGYVHGPWRLPVAPLVLPALKVSPLFAELLTEVGAFTTVQRLLKPAHLQLLRPRQWFELHPDAAARAVELGRALGPEADALESALTRAAVVAEAADAYFKTMPELPPEGFFGRWRLRRAVRRAQGLEQESAIGEATPVDRLLRGLLRFTTAVETPARLTLAHTLGKLLPTPATVPGGGPALHAALLERARELGVDVLDADEQVESLSFEGSKPAGVRFVRSETFYRAGALVAATQLPAIARLVPEARRKPMIKLLAARRPPRTVFTLNLILPASALPAGLGELALVESADVELGALLLQRGAATPRDGEPTRGEQLLTVAVAVPTALKAAGEAAVAALTERVWAALAEVMPFTRASVTLASAAWTEAPRLASLVGEAPVLHALAPDSPLGVGGLPLATPYGRLFQVGSEVLPGLGLEGQALGALRVAARIEKLLKKNDPLKNRRA